MNKKVERRLASSLFSFFQGVIRRLPYRTAMRFADTIAWLGRKLVPSRQRLAARNIQRIFGDRYTPAKCMRIASASTHHLARTMVDTLKLPCFSPDDIRAMVTLEGFEHFQQAFALGRGVIMITGHYGAWELMGARLVLEGVPLTVLGTATSAAARAVNDLRIQAGLQILDPDDVRGMLSILKKNGCLGILPDLRHCTPSSVRVEFMGISALTAVGVATMALHADCPVVPAFCRRKPDGTAHVTVLPPLELIRSGTREENILLNTAQFNRVISEAIMAEPEQWYWLHDRWA